MLRNSETRSWIVHACGPCFADHAMKTDIAELKAEDWPHCPHDTYNEPVSRWMVVISSTTSPTWRESGSTAQILTWKKL